jgi:hypothetical protein
LVSFLSTLLPTIGNLLGGPLGGAAVEAAAKALGMSDATADKVQKALTSGNLSADQIAALQAADLQLKTRMAELGIDAEKLAQADRASAREMQTQSGSWVPSTLAVGVTVGYFTILVGLMSHKFEIANSEGLTLLLGSLTTAWGSIVAFYYGASHLPQPGEKK